MRIALVHDYIKEYGGAERVLEALHEIYPDAPVFTSVYLPNFLGPHRDRFKDWDIRTSFFQHIPFKAKLISPFRLIAPFVFSQFDFSGFDTVIVSSTGAYVKKFKSQNSKVKIIEYCHTPPRYLYGYKTAREWKNHFFFRVLGEAANHILRLIDFRVAQHVDYFIANSDEVRSRIKKFYRREAEVIYPPVGTSKVVTFNLEPKTYFLAGGRLARAKHADLIVEAFSKLNLPLIVFGRGFAGYEEELKNQNSKVKIKTQKSKVQFVGEVTDKEKLKFMGNAKAYVFASEDEDFGITPVEAMSMGTPVITYRSGGIRESVIHGRTGVFFDRLTVEGLIGAVNYFNSSSHQIKAEDCVRQAGKFSKERFKKEIRRFISQNSRAKS
ncbi:glycosyltransferase [Patescibacteria group bacterium]|nr:glycosyltransferase [Patescibacteria group bacterium]